MAVLIQEHHIDAAKHAELNAEAEARAKYGLLYVQAHKPQHEGKGGTAIVMPLDRIELKEKENIDTAIARIKSSSTTTADGRVTTLRTLLHGHEVTVASAYAPVQNDQRAAFYTHALQQAINDKTILGIDANCVPDPRVDEVVHGGQPPPNDGATELQRITRDKDLADIVRETQANKSFYTNHTKISHDRVTRRRIDQIYTPHVDAVIFKHGDKQKDFLRRTKWPKTNERNTTN